MQTGNRKNLPEAELHELHRLVLQRRVVAFVRGEEHRLAGLPQPGRDLLVEVHHPVLHVRDQDQHIRAADCDIDLRRDAAVPHIHFARFTGKHPEAAGIDQLKTALAPDQRRDHPVAGHPRHFVHDRQPTAHDRVEKRGFADIRTAYDSDGRNVHRFRFAVVLFRHKMIPDCKMVPLSGRS